MIKLLQEALQKLDAISKIQTEFFPALSQTAELLEHLNCVRDNPDFASAKERTSFHQAFAQLVSLSSVFEFPEIYDASAIEEIVANKLTSIQTLLENFLYSNS